MAASVELKRRLRWADADAAGRLHFPRIFEIVEEAEGESLRALDWPMDVRRRNDFRGYTSNVDSCECWHWMLPFACSSRQASWAGPQFDTTIRFLMQTTNWPSKVR